MSSAHLSVFFFLILSYTLSSLLYSHLSPSLYLKGSQRISDSEISDYDCEDGVGVITGILRSYYQYHPRLINGWEWMNGWTHFNTSESNMKKQNDNWMRLWRKNNRKFLIFCNVIFLFWHTSINFFVYLISYMSPSIKCLLDLNRVQITFYHIILAQ